MIPAGTTDSDYTRGLLVWFDEVCDRYEAARRSEESLGPEDYLRRLGLDPGSLPRVLLDELAGMAPSSPPSACRQGAASEQTDIPHVHGYEVIGEIARGAMGVVYKARQTNLGRLVALKTIPPDRDGPGNDARLLDEAGVLALVAHPNVVQVHDSGWAGGRPFLVLEYLPGGTLADRLRAGRFYPTDAAALVEKLACGVHAAHEVGIVHRDLKPGNVLFDAEGNPKVGDFGLAQRLSGAKSGDGSVVRYRAGTPPYMSPEQASADPRPVGRASDVWALGVILYECITGRRPFLAAGNDALFSQIEKEEPPRVRRLARNVPRDLEAVIEKCLRKNPAERYASTADLADDLRKVREHERTIHARPCSPWARFAGMLRRSHEDAQFASNAPLILAFAPVMAATEAVVTAVRFAEPPDPFAWVWGVRTVRMAALILLILVFRRGRLDLSAKSEQHVVAVWAGFFAAHLVLNASHPSVWNWDPATELSLYQCSCALSALAFFSVGTRYWGGFHVIGGAFLVLIPALTAAGRSCAVLYGAAWAIALTAIGLHLRSLRRDSA